MIIKYTDNNIIHGFVTLILLQLWTYYTHMLAHKDLCFFNNPYFNWHLHHHNPELSKTFFYILLEFYVNFIISGGFILIFIFLLIEQIFHLNFAINYYIILLWCFSYSTYHIFNYHYLNFETHKNHHINPSEKNYAPDWIDIIFNTKTDGEEIENMNSIIINIILSIFIIFMIKGENYDPIIFINYYINKYIPSIYSNNQ